MNSFSGFCFVCTVLVAGLGCARPEATSPLADVEIAQDTVIYMDSDRYYIRRETTEEPAAQPKLEAVKQSKPKDVKQSKPKAVPFEKTKKKPKADVEFVLTKSKDISVGIATDAPNGRVQNDEVSFVPASITKVLTAAAALRGLGSGFKFKTRIGFDLDPSGRASNLVIYSDGDPTTGTVMVKSGAPTRMSDIATALKSRGVREVQGPMTLLSADARVDAGVYAQGIPDRDAKECYGALSSSFNFNSNCALVRINAKNGFHWEGAGVADHLNNTLETVIGDRTSLSLSAVISPERILHGFALRGVYVAKAPKTLQFRLPISNAAGWYSEEFIKALRVNHIVVTKPIFKYARTHAERGFAKAELARFGSSAITIESASLAEISEEMNKHSDNFLADSLFKALGSRLPTDESSLPAASQQKLREALEVWLTAAGHRNWTNEFLFFDGAGLSVDNRATPRAFLAVLRQLAKEPSFPVLWNSLSIAGVDGTLGDRMKGTAAAGKVRGKTGTLTGSYQLVGFIPKGSGASTEYVPFVILTATTSRNRHVVRNFQDAVVLKMYEAVTSGQ